MSKLHNHCRKKLYLHRNLFLGVLRDCYRNIHNFTFRDLYVHNFYTPAILCLRNTCVPRKVKLYINESIKYMFRILKLLEMIQSQNNLFHLSHLSYPWILKIWSKYYWIIYQISNSPKAKKIYVCSYLNVCPFQKALTLNLFWRESAKSYIRL